MPDREISSYTPPSKDTVKRDSVPDMQRYNRPGFPIVVYLYLFFVGWLYFLVLLVNPEIWSSVRVMTVAGRSRSVWRYQTGRIYSYHRNSAWGMGSSILVVLSYVCVQSFGQLRGWLCPEDDSLNIGEKGAEKSPVWKASFSPMFLNNGWKSTFSALRSYAQSESKIIKLIAKL